MKTVTTILITFIALFIIGCGNRQRPKDSNPLLFADYIVGYTSGVIGIGDEIRIDLANLEGLDSIHVVPSDILHFEPEISGKLSFSNGHSLVFKPGSPLESGKQYTVRFELSKLRKVTPSLSTFNFSFRTGGADYSIDEVTYHSFKQGDQLTTELTGVVNLSDNFPEVLVEKMVSARQSGAKPEIHWTPVSNGSKTKRYFTIRNIQRGNSVSVVTLQADGSPIKSQHDESMEIKIPAKEIFSHLNTRISTDGAKQIELIFSNPIDRLQDLDGLFSLSQTDLEATIDDNIVRLNPRSEVSGNKVLEVFNALRDCNGNRLGKNLSIPVTLDAEKPLVRFIGKGNIIPSGEGLVVPIEAMNLSAVEIRVTKVFKNNFQQFFQFNTLNEFSSLRNVGREVYRGEVNLAKQHAIQLNKWSAFSLRLDDYLTVEPGAIYILKLIMRPEYSLYPCAENDPVKNIKRRVKSVQVNETGEGEDEDGIWSDYEGGYNWRNRNNPCYLTYYIENAICSKALLASNIGLIAKRGNDNKLLVFTTNILTAKPQIGVDVLVNDYQGQLIAKGMTNSEGCVEFQLSRAPFVIKAQHGQDIGYLKITDELSLQMSRFDVGGTEVKKGLKGFLYGERGVWRPGDSLFVSLMVDDKLKQLAPNHPVVFELYNPTEQLDQKWVTELKGNMAVFRSATRSDAPTGNWRLVAKIGGTEFSNRIRIETVKPNRLKMSFQTSKEPLLGGNANQTCSVNVKWLHGAPASGFKTKVDMLLRKGVTQFSKYTGYTFDSQLVKFVQSEQTVFDGKCNDQGDVSFPLVLGALNNSPGKLEAQFTVRAFEPGGDFSITQFSKSVSPFKNYVGLRFPDLDTHQPLLSTGKQNQLDLVVVNADGVPSDSNIDLSVYKIDWRWWWDSTEEYFGNYVSKQHFVPTFHQQLTTSGGKSTFTFTIPNEKWGRYLFIAKLPDGHTVSKAVSIDWPYRPADSEQGGAAMLTLAADKEQYKTGESIALTFPGSEGSKALVCIENGSKVIDHLWVDCQEGTVKVPIKATAEMAPNCYVHVTLIQKHSHTQNDLPIRLYGVIPVSVENANTHLNPVIQVPQNIRSKQPFEVVVSEQGGHPMNYTLALVDEGLLDLTGYKTPDPWKSFYSKEALGVKSWDLFDNVLGAYGGRLERLFAIGGSDQLPDPSKQKAQRFKPVVKFIGPVLLHKGEKRHHSITLPQYTGSVKLMVVGGLDGAYGASDKTTTVSDPLMILATAPRVIGIDESIELPVSLFVHEQNLKSVNVSVSCNALLSVVGQPSQSVTGSNGEKDIKFLLKAGKQVGKALIHVTAQSGSEMANYDVEVQVSNPNPMITTSQSYVIGKGESKSFSTSPSEMELNGSVTVEVSAMPSLNLADRLDYLIAYPHGCVEQTVSSAFAQLMIQPFSDLNVEQKNTAERNIKSGIENLKKFQLGDGAFAYWPGGNFPSSWGTSYAGHFLLEAENLGYAVPSDLKRRWIGFQKNAANFWKANLNERTAFLDQAYRLQTLAMAGSPVLGAMNRLRETPDLPLEARWKLASAYVLAGRPEVAEKLLDMTRLKPQKYDEDPITFGSELRDKAILLESLTLLNRRSEAFVLAKEIALELQGDSWMSTQTTAYSLISLSKFMGGEKAVFPKFKIGSKSGSESVNASNRSWSRSFKSDAIGNKITLTNESSGTLYVSVINHGVASKPAIPKHERGLKLDVTYLSPDGKVLDVRNLTKGTDFTAVVTIKNTGLNKVENLALIQQFPGGWEIINERLFGSASGMTYDYRDIRDDRVMTYFRLNVNEQKEFRVKLTATYGGTYLLPAITCEAMYNHLISANSSGDRVNVRN